MNGSPQHLLWDEARRLLAAAEQAAATRDPTKLGAAVAHTESAIAVLERLAPPPGPPALRRQLAAAWALQARVLEQLGTPTARDTAIHSMDTAIARLDQVAGETDPQLRCDLALALQQAGNLRQQRGTTDDLVAATSQYDRAIDLLRGLPLESHPALRQLLGGIWLNRGVTFVRRTEPEAAAEALRSFDEAIAAWNTLPAATPPTAQQINLAAAWMNRAHTLLRLHGNAAGAAAVRTAANEALTRVTASEQEHPGAADIGLKSRHILCRAIGLQLAAAEHGAASDRDDLFAAATDTVDDGLALARGLAHGGATVPLAFVADLFRFGVQTYLSYQPHFLAEFVLENLDRQAAEHALPWHESLHAIATEGVTRALRELERPRIHTVDAPDAERRIQALHDLRHAAARLAALPAENAPAQP